MLFDDARKVYISSKYYITLSDEMPNMIPEDQLSPKLDRVGILKH